jgi:hypothetical protein
MCTISGVLEVCCWQPKHGLGCDELVTICFIVGGGVYTLLYSRACFASGSMCAVLHREAYFASMSCVICLMAGVFQQLPLPLLLQLGAVSSAAARWSLSDWVVCYCPLGCGVLHGCTHTAVAAQCIDVAAFLGVHCSVCVCGATAGHIAVVEGMSVFEHNFWVGMHRGRYSSAGGTVSAGSWRCGSPTASLSATCCAADDDQHALRLCRCAEASWQEACSCHCCYCSMRVEAS